MTVGVGEQMPRHARSPKSSVTPEHLDVLHGAMPELFDLKPLPDDWEERIDLVPSDGALSPHIGKDGVERDLFPDLMNEQRSDEKLAFDLGPGFPDFPDLEGIRWPADVRFPGAPESVLPKGKVPKTDVLAFYLPFHYYYPSAWGVYIFAECIEYLAKSLQDVVRGLSGMDAFVASRAFLYGHEVFHHRVEAFATRLEVTHRQAFYKTGFDSVYKNGQSIGDCVEESLANAHALWRVREVLRNRASSRRAVQEALTEYVRQQPAGYRRGADIADDKSFNRCRNHFAEVNMAASNSGRPQSRADVWGSFTHAFDGFIRRGCPVSYVLPKGSPLAARTGLQGRFLRYREVESRLRKLKCHPTGQQSGSHVKWEGPSGHRFEVPQHPGDLGRGLLARIVKQAGLGMSLSQFVASQA